MSFDPSLGRVGTATTTQLVGVQRYKYFSRPVLPAMTAMPVTVLLAPTAAVNPLQPPPVRELQKSRTIAIQTDYRESEVQTDPYTPDFIVPEGKEPEVMALAGLKWGAGLPAGPAELMKIDRLRYRRELEKQLPTETDPASLARRKLMLEQIEQHQWVNRENDIIEIQEQRLEQLRSALIAREEEQAAAREDRLTQMRRTRALHLDDSLATIQRRRVQTMRKLADSRKVVRMPTSELHKRRDIVSDYSNHASKVYAPVTREGAVPVTNAPDYDEFTSSLTRTTGGLYMLSETLPRRMQTPQQAARAVTALAQTRGMSATRAGPRLTQRELRQASSDLERVAAKLESDGKQRATPPPPRSRHPVERPIERPRTPTLGEALHADDGKEQAVLFLQRLLRGRAVQNAMFLGKERRAELLQELRATVDTAPRSTVQDTVTAARLAVADSIAGQVAGDALVVLAQHRVRDAMHAQALLLAQTADTQRRAREAEEAATRKREVRERARADEQYRQLSRVHTDTAASLVDSALSAAMTSAATATAAPASATAAAPTAAASAGAEGSGVESLLQYLLPAVARDAAAQQAQTEQTKYKLAVSEALAAGVEVQTQTETTGRPR